MGANYRYMLFVFLTQCYFTAYGMMAVALTPSLQLAAVLSSTFYSIWNLFSGFLIPRPVRFTLKALHCYSPDALHYKARRARYHARDSARD